MNWCNFEYSNVITTIIGFVILAVIIAKTFRKRKLFIIGVLIILLWLTPITLVQAQNNLTTQENPLRYSYQQTMYRYGDLAVAPIFFPINMKTYRAVWVNESGNLTAYWVEEITPTKLYNPITVSFAVFNVSKENPVYLFVDNLRYEITSEGVYYYSFNLTEGVHSFVLACKYQIFVRSLVLAENREKPKIELVSFTPKVWQELLLRFGMLAFIGGAVGSYGAIEVKKRITKITTTYAYLIIIPAFAIGYYFRISAVALFAFASAFALTYRFSKDYANLVLLLKREKHRIDRKPLYVDDDGYAISWIWDKWRPKMKKQKVEYKDYYELKFGDLDAIFYKEKEETDDKIKIICDKHFMQALIDAEIVEKLDKRLSEMEIEVNFLRKAALARAMRIVDVFEEILETTVLDKAARDYEFKIAMEKAKEKVREMEKEFKAEKLAETLRKVVGESEQKSETD